MSRFGRSGLVCVVGVAALLAAACSSGSDGGSPASPTTTIERTTTTTSPVTETDLDRFAQQLLEQTGATGGIVGLSAGGAAPVVVAAGTEAAASGEVGRAMNVDAPLHVASVTKSYVAALALVLAAEGLVALDAPIATWADWPGGDRITLRQLLTHTSGLGRFGDGEEASAFLDLVAAGKVVGLDEVLDAARATPPLGPPGEDTRYGNLNYLWPGPCSRRRRGSR